MTSNSPFVSVAPGDRLSSRFQRDDLNVSQFELADLNHDRPDENYRVGDGQLLSSEAIDDDAMAEEILQASLPRADGGRDAWMFLIAGFLLEAMVWGFPFSYGVFQDYYNKTDPFASESSGTAVIGTCASGIMYLGAPVVLHFLNLYPHIRNHVGIGGFLIMELSLVLASFSTTIWQLILTQGIMYAIGGSLLYCPCMLYLDEWFIKRKGLAYGLMWAGTGTSGLVVPFLMSWLLSSYGYQTALRVWAAVGLVLITPSLFAIKPRIPITRNANTTARRVSWAFLNTTAFWFLAVGNTIEGLGYFIPGVYIASYAESLQLPSISGSLIIALVNSSSVIGIVGLGMLSDYVHITTVIFISAIGSALSVFLCWGLSASLPVLCVFGLFYGLFAGGFSSTWPGIVVEIKKNVPGTDTGTVLGMMTFGRGIGAVCSGPLSEALLKGHSLSEMPASGYNSGYSPLIIFTGVTAFLGGLGFLGRQCRMV